MSTNIIFNERSLQMMPTGSPKSSEEAKVKRIGSNFIRFKNDMADAVQSLPEMTDAEVLKANEVAGGFDWLKNPIEDLYQE